MKPLQVITLLGICFLFLLVTANPVQANLILNGSFESGPPLDYNPGLWANVPAGATTIDNWTVILSDIDYKGSTFWQPSDGERSLDLNGDNGAGGIEQDFDTVIGQLYQVMFDMAGNPSTNPLNTPTTKWMRVEADGDFADFSFDVVGKSNAAMGWEGKSWSFTATDLTTTLRFISLDPTRTYGPALDNVSVFIPEPATLALLGIGSLTLFIRRRRN